MKEAPLGAGVLADHGTAVLIGCVALTALVIAEVVRSGLRGRRRRHFVGIAIALAMLVTTILVAESVGRHFTFDPLVQRVHFTFAYSTILCLAGVIVAGVWRLRRAAARLPHRVAVGIFLFVLVGAVGTGGWMMSTGVSRVESPPTETASLPETD